jgi:hypothetical protein
LKDEKTAALCDVMTFSFVQIYRGYGKIYRLLSQGRKATEFAGFMDFVEEFFGLCYFIYMFYPNFELALPRMKTLNPLKTKRICFI